MKNKICYSQCKDDPWTICIFDEDITRIVYYHIDLGAFQYPDKVVKDDIIIETKQDADELLTNLWYEMS